MKTLTREQEIIIANHLWESGDILSDIDFLSLEEIKEDKHYEDEKQLKSLEKLFNDETLKDEDKEQIINFYISMWDMEQLLGQSHGFFKEEEITQLKAISNIDNIITNELYYCGCDDDTHNDLIKKEGK